MKNWLGKLKKNGYYLKKSSKTAKPFMKDYWRPMDMKLSSAQQEGRFDQFVRDGYKHNVIVYRCINLIARALSSVPLVLYRQEYYLNHNQISKEHEIETHPVLDLLNAPSPMISGSNFMEHLVNYLLLSGNGYIEAIVDGDGIPVGLKLHRPDRVRVMEKGYMTMHDGYDGSIGSAPAHCLHFIHKDIISGRSNMLHIKLFNPLNDRYGLSPMEAAAHAIDQHNAVGGHNLALLRNGGRPSGALMLKQGAYGLGLSEMQRDTLKGELKTILEGRDNAGRVMVLEGDFEWKEMGMTPKDLDFAEGKNIAAREICQAFGVPPMLAGVPGDATFANYKEARFHLWEDTVLPLLDSIVAELNAWLLPYYDTNLKFSYDLDSIQALAPKREMAWAKVESAAFLTINEKRQAVGYGPITNGDQLFNSEIGNQKSFSVV